MTEEKKFTYWWRPAEMFRVCEKDNFAIMYARSELEALDNKGTIISIKEVP